MRHLVGALVQLPVGEPLIPPHHREGFRRAADLLLEEGVQAPGLTALRAGVVPAGQDLLAFRRGEQAQRADGPVGVGQGVFEQLPQVSGHAPDRGGVEQVGAVFQLADQPFPQMPDTQGEIEPGRGARQVDALHREPGEFRCFLCFLAPFRRAEKHLKQWGGTRITFRLKDSDQLFERHVAVHPGLPHRRVHPADDLAETGLEPGAGKVAAEHHRVGEVPDRAVRFALGPVGQDRAHRNVPLVAVVRKQGLERREDRGCHGGPPAVAEAGQPVRQLLAELEALDRTASAPYGGPTSVARQPQHRGHAIEPLPPVFQ
ncbi:hypothetical protein SAZ11_01175 [Streptomyces sp. FXJ1.4098]|nr:hypothetical protein [Streptomyces sp. FXJ1.4098]